MSKDLQISSLRRKSFLEFESRRTRNADMITCRPRDNNVQKALDLENGRNSLFFQDFESAEAEFLENSIEIEKNRILRCVNELENIKREEKETLESISLVLKRKSDCQHKVNNFVDNSCKASMEIDEEIEKSEKLLITNHQNLELIKNKQDSQKNQKKELKRNLRIEELKLLMTNQRMETINNYNSQIMMQTNSINEEVYNLKARISHLLQICCKEHNLWIEEKRKNNMLNEKIANCKIFKIREKKQKY